MDNYEHTKVNTKRYKKVKKLLKTCFGYDEFREHQYEIINTIFNEKDVTAILPTGYGKSLCFQLPAVYRNEPVIVISPLIALMEDQKMLMNKIGINACCYNSMAKKDKLESEILEGKYRIIYITPESVIKCSDLLNQLYETHGISMFAIDEAHCISSYGFDFRKSYRELYKLREICKGVPIMAVTATATEDVVADINKVMMMDGIVVKTSFNRPNLTLYVNQKDKYTDNDIIDTITGSDGSHIVYCVTKNDTEVLCNTLKNAGIQAGVYHAGMKYKERQDTQTKFANGEYNVVVATIAFGMGINKSNVRTVIHYGCPKNIESYYQEIGRAGRDGKESKCYLYYATKDFIVQKRFIQEIQDTSYRLTRMKLLDIMDKFVRTKLCRKKIILEYFGDNSIKDKCGKCDNCMRLHNPEKEQNSDTNLIKTHGNDMYRLLTVIKDVNCNFGTGIIIGIIRGSKSKKINARYFKHKFYGDGRKTSDKWWKDLVELLINSEYVESFAISPMIYVPKITKKGLNFLSNYNFNSLMDVVADVHF